jgi:hypothetical protein
MPDAEFLGKAGPQRHSRVPYDLSAAGLITPSEGIGDINAGNSSGRNCLSCKRRRDSNRYRPVPLQHQRANSKSTTLSTIHRLWRSDIAEGFSRMGIRGSPLTPNALNGGMAGFPEFHNVYIEPGSYEIYKKTNVFPEGTIFFKELQLTLPPAENPDGSRTEPSGRGYFPGPWNGADVTVKDSKRYADTGGWGFYNFNHHEPKAPTAKLKSKDECAFCHMASAKKDEVWTQFYPLLDR